MCQTHSDHGLYWLLRNTYSFRTSSIACSVDIEVTVHTLTQFLKSVMYTIHAFFGLQMPPATPTRDCDVSKCATGNLLIFKHMKVGASDLTETPKIGKIAHFETDFIMKECKDGSICYLYGNHLALLQH